MQETPFQFLGQEDFLEKGMAAHSSILAWRIPWTEKPGGLPSMGLQRVDLGLGAWSGIERCQCDLNDLVSWLNLDWV